MSAMFECRKKNVSRSIILVVIFVSFLGKVQAQEKNSISEESSVSLSTVTVLDTIDAPKYLWNLLNYNYNKSLKDTSLYY